MVSPQLMAALLSLPRILPKVALILVALALMAGCGSSDDGPKQFDEDDFDITFEYPGDFERTEDVELSQSEGQAEQSIAFAKSEDNAIFVQRYALNRPVDVEDGEAVREELDEVLGTLAGEPVEGERIEVGELLAFRYEIDQLETPEDGRSTIVAVFDGSTEYFINCQSVPDGREELETACERAIDTLRPKQG
jgi:hypothetical protein